MSATARARLALATLSLVLLSAFSSGAHADPVKCKRAIAKATALFARAEHTALQNCVHDRRTAGDAPAGTLAACKAKPDVAARLARAAATMTTIIDRACGGQDKHCGGDLTNEDTPASLGWPSGCPNLENGACANQILDCKDIVTCLQCISQSAVEEIITRDYETFVDQSADTTENACQGSITQAVRKYFSGESTAMQTCWDNIFRGKSGFAAPCPGGDASGRAQRAIDRAKELNVRTICKACGASGDKNMDGQCDAPGFNPQTDIGFGLSCPQIQAPNGTDCGAIGTIDTLQKYVDCIGCTTAFAAECGSHSGVIGTSPYPPECNPGHSITLNGATVGKDLQTSTNGSLSLPAPAGNLQVTITSADPSRVRLSTASNAAGTASITVQVGAGSTTIPTFYVQGLAKTGGVGITASAPLYSAGTATVTLSPSGFVYYGQNIWGNSCSVYPYSYCGTDFTSYSNSPDSRLGINSVLLDASFNVWTFQSLRPGIGSINVPVSSGNGAVGTILNGPAVFSGGDAGNTSVTFHPLAPGSSDLTLGTPAGFDTPTSRTQITATVTAPNLYFDSNVNVGEDLQSAVNVYLTTAPAGPVDVTVTVTDPAVAIISNAASVVGTNSVTFSNVTGTYAGTVYVQGIDRSVGPSTTLTAQTTGYLDGTTTVTVYPSGFGYYGNNYYCYYYNWGCTDFTTYSNSPDSSLGINPFMLDTSFNVWQVQSLRPGIGPIDVPVSSSNGAVGTILNSPAVFSGGDAGNTGVSFHPLAPGSSALTLGTPAGFDTPTSQTQITATVTAPNLYFDSNPNVGEDLQNTVNVYLASAPAGPVAVTVTVNDPAVAIISDTASVVGTNSVTFSNVTGTFAGTVYVQGIDRSVGPSTTLTAQTTGYLDGTTTVTVYPSGFGYYGYYYYCYYTWGWCGTDFTTYSNSPDSALGINSFMLDTSFNIWTFQSLRPGIGPIDVPVSSGNGAVGTIVNSPAVFSGGDGGNTGVSFHPLAPGSSNLTLGTPAGFDTPTSQTQITATVTASSLSFSSADVHVGRNLQTAVTLYLTPLPSPAVNVTVTSSDGTKVTLEDAAHHTSAGTGTLVLNGVSTSSVTVYVQGLYPTGSPVTLTATASGYTSAGANVTVEEAGFVFSDGDFSWSFSQGDRALTIRPVRLDPVFLNVLSDIYDDQEVRGGLSNVQVPVGSSMTSVGTVVGAPAVFQGGDNVNTGVALHPVATGTTQLSVGTPALFSPPSSGTSITATVAGPYLSFSGDVHVGRNLQTPITLYLTPPPSPAVDVTVSSSDGTKVTLEDAAHHTSAGTGTLTLNGVSTSSVTVYVQGVYPTGSPVTLTATASGYDGGGAAVTVEEAGFVFSSGDFSWSVSNGDDALAIRAVRLDPVFLNVLSDIYDYQEVRGGLSNVQVPVGSSMMSVGTVVGAPAVFNAGDSANTDVTFHPVMTGTTQLSVDTPSGFSPPSNGNTSITVTVTP